MTLSSPSEPLLQCRWCGEVHGPRCPRVRVIEFYPDGVTIKRVEFVRQREATGGFTWTDDADSSSLARSDED